MRTDSSVTTWWRARRLRHASAMAFSLLFASAALVVPSAWAQPAPPEQPPGGPTETAPPSLAAPALAAAAARPTVLVFRGPASRQDDAVAKATATVRQLGQNNGFDVEVSEDPAVFAGSDSSRFRAVVFLASAGSELNQAQEAGLQDYVRAGGGFLGIHDAALAQQDSEWFTGLVGARPAGSPFKIQQAVVEVVDRQHPANAGLGLTWTRSDKWTNWAGNPIGNVHTVAQVRETSYNPGDGANGAFHPISWCRDYDGGRSFYTGMGGTAASYSDDGFRNHLKGAVLWATGMVRGDCKATIGSNYTIERLTATNQAGQLDQIGEPHGLTVAPDGKVFYVGKAACRTRPDRAVGGPQRRPRLRHHPRVRPDDEVDKLLTTLAVMGHRGGGDELQKNEEGLLGIVPDPNFAQNNWLYVYWMPHETVDRVRHVGKRTISRFTYDPSGPDDRPGEPRRTSCSGRPRSTAAATQVAAWRSTPRATSTSAPVTPTPPAGRSGYSGNNWTQEFAGISFQDARRTSGNTNDLNGKMIRIHPEADGTYTIPEGNLFTGQEEGGGKTRPEIYVMGVRNIARLQVDPDTQWVTTGWVGPDATRPEPEAGARRSTRPPRSSPRRATRAGPSAWATSSPTATAATPTRTVRPTGTTATTWSTTRRATPVWSNIPPARTNMIWYAPSGGGPVFPSAVDGAPIPTYDRVGGDLHPAVPPRRRPGGHVGPDVPQASEVEPGSDGAWPSYWEGKWLIGD